MMDNYPQGGRVFKPCHCFFWMATLRSNRVIPEFDFENLVHNHVRDLPLDEIMRFCWYPVSLTMLERVWEFFHESLRVAKSEQIFCLNIDLDVGERLRVHPVWRHDMVFRGIGGVTTRYACFKVSPGGETMGFWVDDDGEKIE